LGPFQKRTLEPVVIQNGAGGATQCYCCFQYNQIKIRSTLSSKMPLHYWDHFKTKLQSLRSYKTVPEALHNATDVSSIIKSK